ncbi:MAG: hypothetical protein GY838_08400 [bacterium]|nr:hypothetical protein [bacterium]
MRASTGCYLAAACLLLAGLVGCSEDNDDSFGGLDPDPCEDDALPFPGSPEQITANFKTAYDNRDFDGYREMLDPAFRIELKQQTIDEFDLPKSYFDYEQDLLITEMMFSGNPPGPNIGAIADIDIILLSQIDTWDTTANEDFAGLLESQFDVIFRILQTTTDGEKQFNINGRLVFFLSGEQIEYCGREYTNYRLAGMIDETDSGKAGPVPTEDSSWGDLKALFLPSPDPSR